MKPPFTARSHLPFRHGLSRITHANSGRVHEARRKRCTTSSAPSSNKRMQLTGRGGLVWRASRANLR